VPAINFGVLLKIALSPPPQCPSLERARGSLGLGTSADPVHHRRATQLGQASCAGRHALGRASVASHAALLVGTQDDSPSSEGRSSSFCFPANSRQWAGTPRPPPTVSTH
jgi:hypothetical protein